MDARLIIDGTTRNTIAAIKAATGKHGSDEEIYTMYKECNMDANETAQKLLYLDTFHVVKRKRDRKPVNARPFEGPRWAGNRGRGPRDGQGQYSSHNANGAGLGRKSNTQRENGVANQQERDQKPSAPAVEKTSNVAAKSSSPSHVIAKSTQAGVKTGKSSKSKLKETPAKPSQAQSSVTSSELAEGSSVLDGQFSEQSNSLPTEVASDSATLAAGGSSQSINELGLSSSESSTKLLDAKLKKLNISYRPVIFPEHLQVPEELILGLTFGSFDSPSDQGVEVSGSDEVNVSSPAVEPLKENEEIEKDTSVSIEVVPSSIAQESEYPDNSQFPVHAPETSSHLEDDVPCEDATLKNDQSTQEVKLPQGGNQYSFVAAPNYSFPFAGHILGNQIVQSEGIGQQTETPQVSSSTPATSQPAALSPPPFPIFRHPYQPGYMPFNPYYHPYYYSSTGQPFLGQGGFPQQPPTGNAYLAAAAAAAAGGKFPVQPSQSGLNAGSVPQYGFPAGYGSYSPGLAPTSGSSAGNQDLGASAFKDNTVYTTVQQADGSSLVWPPPPVRDLSGLPATSFYNHHVPQGHRVTLPPSQGGYATGVYHQAQAMAGAAPNAHPHMQHLSQTMAGSNEPTMRSASGAYQQQQQQQQHQAQRNVLNWSPNPNY